MATRMGRPRSDSAHAAILKAALRLVTKNGFQAVTVNEISAEAGVGKMTLYRHWPNKAAVVMDALLTLIGDETAFPEAETALESLERQLERQVAFFKGSRGTLIRSLVAEAQSDPELASAFRERWLEPRRDGVRRTMQRAVDEGSLRAGTDVDVSIDLLYGAIYYRLLLGSGPLDEVFVQELLRQFLEGHARREQARPRSATGSVRKPRS